MSREQAFVVVAEKLPNYSQYDDCKALINYFYDNYNTAFMPPAVREINAKAQYMAKQGMRRPDPSDPHGTESNRKTHFEKNTVSPVPEIQGKAKSGHNKARPVQRGGG